MIHPISSRSLGWAGLYMASPTLPGAVNLLRTIWLCKIQRYRVTECRPVTVIVSRKLVIITTLCTVTVGCCCSAVKEDPNIIHQLLSTTLSTRARAWNEGSQRNSIESYSRPSLMIIASSRGLLRDYEPSDGPSLQALVSYELTWSRWIWLWPGRGPRGWWSSRLGKCARALDNDPRTRARTPQGRWPPAWQYTVIQWGDNSHFSHILPLSLSFESSCH